MPNFNFSKLTTAVSRLVQQPGNWQTATFTTLVGVGGALGALLASCTSTPPQPQTSNPNLPPVKVVPPAVIYPPVQRPTPTTPTQPYQSFANWKNDFIQRAAAQGYNYNDLQRLIGNADYNERVVSLDKNQAEFAKMPWEYIDGVLASSRVAGGKRNYANQQAVLMRGESQYGVPASIVTAIWGMESSYGASMGNTPLVDSLTTLAYDGRRRGFAEEQLLALLQLVERGDLDWSQLKGSWAGGMGHTQFIPKTWLTEGVDGNGDGHRNPFNSADALNSTASYLAHAGWQRGLSPFYEVSLPSGFDYRTVGSKRSVGEWQQLGVNFVGNSMPSNTLAELWLPAGKEGPALLLTKNFDVVKVYNNSSNYALGVSLLAKAIVGQPGLQKDFPRYEQPLYTSQVSELQRRLTSQGFDTKGTDGVIGTNTKLAFQQWQLAHGQTPDGFISQRSAAELLR